MPETKKSPAENTPDREIVLTRILDAPRDLVWQAITNPRNVVNWWGPTGFSITIEEMDVRPGGLWKHTMHGPDGTDYPGEAVFNEVVKPERLSFTHTGGKKGEPSANFESTWTFEPHGEKTKLTLRMVFESPAARDLNVKTYKSIEGGQQTLARLAEYLPKISPVSSRIARTIRAKSNPRSERPPRTSLQSLDRSKTRSPMVGPARLHKSSLRSRRPPRRPNAHPHARPRRHDLSNDRHLQ